MLPGKYIIINQLVKHMTFERRVALYVLRDKNGKVLLQHRDKNAPRLPEMWGFFGGDIEGSESPKVAALREAREELGLELKSLEFFRRYELPDRHGKYHEFFVFVAPLDHDIKQLKSQQHEGDNLGMFSFDDIRTMQFEEHDLVILNDLFGESEKVGMLEVEKKES